MSDMKLSREDIPEDENKALIEENEELASIVRACRESVWVDMKMSERLQKRASARHLRNLLDRIDGQCADTATEKAGEVKP